MWMKKSSGKIRVAALVSRREDGAPTGSAFVRLILPLTHTSITEYISFVP